MSDRDDSERRCRICGGPLADPLIVREMMFGTRDEFVYYTCRDCQCLQISEIPDAIDRYYGADYYSLSQEDEGSGVIKNPKHKRRYHRWRLLGPFRHLLPWPKTVPRILGALGVGFDDRILDVGSGSGALILTLAGIGFRNAIGIDPFLDKDITNNEGRMIARKADVFGTEPEWDLIMFNHSFEHIAEQVATLERCRHLVAPGGSVLIRIPTVSSYAYRKYGANWVQLDAPRHFFLHSRRSIALAAEIAGFRTAAIWDDSTAAQFIGSEQYVRDIPLTAENSYSISAEKSPFARSAIHRFKKEAKRLNRAGEGDQICVLLAPDACD